MVVGRFGILYSHRGFRCAVRDHPRSPFSRAHRGHLRDNYRVAIAGTNRLALVVPVDTRIIQYRVPLKRLQRPASPSDVRNGFAFPSDPPKFLPEAPPPDIPSHAPSVRTVH